jgi:hypothetical protein
MAPLQHQEEAPLTAAPQGGEGDPPIWRQRGGPLLPRCPEWRGAASEAASEVEGLGQGRSIAPRGGESRLNGYERWALSRR